jgi:hypothetical protein
MRIENKTEDYVDDRSEIPGPEKAGIALQRICQNKAHGNPHRKVDNRDQKEVPDPADASEQSADCNNKADDQIVRRDDAQKVDAGLITSGSLFPTNSPIRSSGISCMIRTTTTVKEKQISVEA